MQNQNKEMTLYRKLPNELNNYAILSVIGKGATATVYLGTHLPTKKICAIKIINLKDDANSTIDKNMFYREIEIMKSIDNIFCVTIYDYYIDDDTIIIVMEYCEMGTLLGLLTSNYPLNTKQVVVIMTEIAFAIASLHSHGIIHRDIKLENILLDRNGHVRISDFGFSRKMLTEKEKKLNSLMTICGSPNYASPEMIKRLLYNEKTDVWSIGVVFYALLFKTFPFQSANIQELYHQILFEEPHYPNFDEDGIDLVKKLLEKDPQKRMELKSFFYHPFLAKYFHFDSDFEGLISISSLQRIKFPKIIQKTADILSTSEQEVIEVVKNSSFNSISSTYRLLRDDLLIHFLNNRIGNLRDNFEISYSKYPVKVIDIKSEKVSNFELEGDFGEHENQNDQKNKYKQMIWQPHCQHNTGCLNRMNLPLINRCPTLRRNVANKGFAYKRRNINPVTNGSICKGPSTHLPIIV